MYLDFAEALMPTVILILSIPLILLGGIVVPVYYTYLAFSIGHVLGAIVALVCLIIGTTIVCVLARRYIRDYLTRK